MRRPPESSGAGEWLQRAAPWPPASQPACMDARPTLAGLCTRPSSRQPAPRDIQFCVEDITEGDPRRCGVRWCANSAAPASANSAAPACAAAAAVLPCRRCRGDGAAAGGQRHQGGAHALAGPVPRSPGRPAGHSPLRVRPCPHRLRLPLPAQARGDHGRPGPAGGVPLPTQPPGPALCAPAPNACLCLCLRRHVEITDDRGQQVEFPFSRGVSFYEVNEAGQIVFGASSGVGGGV